MQIPAIRINENADHSDHRKQVSALRLKGICPRQINRDKNRQERSEKRDAKLHDTLDNSAADDRGNEIKAEQNIKDREKPIEIFGSPDIHVSVAADETREAELMPLQP